MILESIVLLSSLVSSHNVGQLPKPNHYQQVLTRGIVEMDSRLVVCMSQYMTNYLVSRIREIICLNIKANIACARLMAHRSPIN